MSSSTGTGANTPESQLESVLPIHPTAARRTSSIVVQSELTAYTNEFITSKFTNRGADVTVVEGHHMTIMTGVGVAGPTMLKKRRVALAVVRRHTRRAIARIAG